MMSRSSRAHCTSGAEHQIRGDGSQERVDGVTIGEGEAPAEPPVPYRRGGSPGGSPSRHCNSNREPCRFAASVGYVATQQLPGSEVWVNAVLWRLALPYAAALGLDAPLLRVKGLSASGLHSGANKVGEGYGEGDRNIVATPQVPTGQGCRPLRA